MTLYRMVLKIPKNRGLITGIRMNSDPIKEFNDAGNVVICGSRTTGEHACKLSLATAMDNLAKFVLSFGDIYMITKFLNVKRRTNV